jgi:RNA polymerase sigma-70 factor (ECF subfamily)
VRNSTLDRLVVEHLPAALAFATRLTGQADRAEEIVQEALLRVVRNWKSFRGEATFRTWFFRIVINVFRDGLASSGDHEVPLGEGAVDPSDEGTSDPVAMAMAVELHERVAMEVSRLPPRQREVLVLSVYEAMSAREIAAVLDISEANVHSTLSLARSRLKLRLASYFKSVES